MLNENINTAPTGVPGSALPVPDGTKFNESELRQYLWQRDQSATFVYHMFTICGFESLSEVKAIIKAKNPDLYEDMDQIIAKLESLNAISVIGDRVICPSANDYVTSKYPAEKLISFLGDYIKKLITRTIKNHISGHKNKDSEYVNWVTLSGDEQTINELKEARGKYHKMIDEIAERANAENRRASQTICTYFGMTIPQAEDL